jgi:hypothetical protein
VGQIWFKPNFEFGIFQIKSWKVENGQKKFKTILVPILNLMFRIWTEFEFIRKYTSKPATAALTYGCRALTGCLVGEKKIFSVTSDMSEKCREWFLDTNKKITEPVRKLRDESNDTN